ncbi:hypothetical protein BD560DRAFT_485819 [Blakeslea trispora]|nr:hypothetical protein BD560DRAFT_485819 [Blakeslea trispora]
MTFDVEFASHVYVCPFDLLVARSINFEINPTVAKFWRVVNLDTQEPAWLKHSSLCTKDMDSNYSYVHWTKNRLLVNSDEWFDVLKADEAIKLPDNFDSSQLAEQQFQLKDLLKQNNKGPKKPKYEWKTNPMTT